MGAFSNGKASDDDFTCLKFYILRDGDQTWLMNQKRDMRCKSQLTHTSITSINEILTNTINNERQTVNSIYSADVEPASFVSATIQKTDYCKP
jgi:hypothetical protein